MSQPQRQKKRVRVEIINTPWGGGARVPFSCPVVHHHVPPPVSPRVCPSLQCDSWEMGPPLSSACNDGRGVCSKLYHPPWDSETPLLLVRLVIEGPLPDILFFIDITLQNIWIFYLAWNGALLRACWACKPELPSQNVVLLCKILCLSSLPGDFYEHSLKFEKYLNFYYYEIIPENFCLKFY